MLADCSKFAWFYGERRSCALHTLEATRWNVYHVSLWLGHDSMASTELYFRGNTAEKLKILDANVPPTIRKGPSRVRRTSVSGC